MKYLLILFLVFHGDPEIPTLNLKVIEYVSFAIGTQVDSGECWDLAAAALSFSGAYHDRSSQKNIYIFGKVVDPYSEEILPGDIIQFENVKLEYAKGNAIYTESMVHHTAIVFEVSDKGKYRIAHQNTSFSGRKVGISDFNLSEVIKGKVIFYRPYKK